jgi:AraC family transcriptional regulator
MDNNLQQIQALVGPITPRQMQDVEGAVFEHIGLFVPVTGPCRYATSPAHTHPAYSFVLTFDEGCRLLIDQQPVSIPARRICALSPNVPHQELPDPRFSRYIALFIDASRFEAELNSYPLPRPNFRARIVTIPDALLRYAREFLMEYNLQRPGYQIILPATASLIIHHLIRALYLLEPATPSVTGCPQMNRAIEQIYQRFGEKLTTNLLARAAGLSSAHFSREFKKMTNRTPMEYLRDVRLNRARTLMLDSSLTLTEIAHRCGFNSSSYFSSCFCKYYNLTPSTFRSMFNTASS